MIGIPFVFNCFSDHRVTYHNQAQSGKKMKEPIF